MSAFLMNPTQTRKPALYEQREVNLSSGDAPVGAESALTRLGFHTWPFHTVPTPYSIQSLCDRMTLREFLRRLIAAYKNRDDSIANLVWAAVGAGKTHTLRHLMFLLEKEGFGTVLLVEMPENAHGMIDLHDAIMSAIGFEKMLEAYFDDQSCFEDAPLLLQLCKAAMSGPELEAAANRWVSGIADLRTVRSLGLPTRISHDQCVANLVGILSAVRKGNPKRSVLLIDEFQRVASAPRRICNEVQSGLCSIINRLPVGLGLILSFAADPSAALPSWIETNLASRIGKSQFVPILPLSRTEAKAFMQDLLLNYATNDLPSPYHPFTEPAINRLIDLSGGERVLPRDLIGNADFIFSQYILSDMKTPIGPNDVRLSI